MPRQGFTTDVKIYNKLMTNYNTEYNYITKDKCGFGMNYLRPDHPLRTISQNKLMNGDTNLNQYGGNYRSLKQDLPWYDNAGWFAKRGKTRKNYKDAVNEIYRDVPANTNFTSDDFQYPNKNKGQDINGYDVQLHKLLLYDYHAHSIHTNANEQQVPEFVPNFTKARMNSNYEDGFTYGTDNAAGFPNLGYATRLPLMWQTRQPRKEGEGGSCSLNWDEIGGDSTNSARLTTYYLYPEDPKVHYVTDVEKITTSGNPSTSENILKPTFKNGDELCPNTSTYYANPIFLESRPSRAQDISHLDHRNNPYMPLTGTHGSPPSSNSKDNTTLPNMQTERKSTMVDGEKTVPLGTPLSIDAAPMVYYLNGSRLGAAAVYDTLNNKTVTDLKNQYYDTASCQYEWVDNVHTTDNASTYAQSFVNDIVKKPNVHTLKNADGKTQYRQIVEQLCKIDNGDKYAGVQLPNAVDQSDVSISSRVCALVGDDTDTNSVYNKMNAFCGETKNKKMPACKFYNLAQFENNIKTTDAETRVFSRYDSLTSEQKTYAGIKDVIAEINYMKDQEVNGKVAEDNPLRYSTFNNNLRAVTLSSYSPICLTGSDIGEQANPSSLFPRPNSNYPKCNFDLTVCEVKVPMQDVTARTINTKVTQRCGSTTPPSPSPSPTSGGGGGGGGGCCGFGAGGGG